MRERRGKLEADLAAQHFETRLTCTLLSRQDPFVATNARSAFLDLSGVNALDNCETNQPTSINHLSEEILAEIFHFCQEGIIVRKFDSTARPRRREVPLLLCQICHHWREVALSLPCLWNSLAASGLGPFIPHPALIELRLSRSRGQPLSLHFALSQTPVVTTHYNIILMHPKYLNYSQRKCIDGVQYLLY